MSSIRVYVVLLVMLVQLHSIHSKPLFFDFICDFVCDDDDNTSTSTTTSSSNEDDFFDFCDCTPTPRRPNRRGQQYGPSAFNMRLPPSNGMNLSLNNTNGVWSFNLDALQPALQNGLPTPRGSQTPAPPTATSGTVTAAGTTVAPTTAKK